MNPAEIPMFNPDSWMDLVAYGLLALPGSIAAIAAIRGHRKSKDTLNQVQNSHDTNLRDDIDGLREAISDGFGEVRGDISGLRAELRTERLERIEGDRLRIVRR